MLATAAALAARERAWRLQRTVVAEPRDPRVWTARIVDHLLDNRPRFGQDWLRWRAQG
jgi:hypothetical protein